MDPGQIKSDTTGILEPLFPDGVRSVFSESAPADVDRYPEEERFTKQEILYLYLNEIEHTRTKARHPQPTGCTERLNQTIMDEFYQVAFRKKLYTSLEEIQSDLDSFMEIYNTKRTNQGKRCQGRTPMETFTAGLELCNRYVQENGEEVTKEAA